jgi:hypothetical protein
VIEKVLSKNDIHIRLTDERWTHIVEEHCELAGMRMEVLDAVANPSRILKGGESELLAVQEIHSDKHLVVVYREIENDGFIITAFITSKTKSLYRRNPLWPK